jgi:hypothetical protein
VLAVASHEFDPWAEETPRRRSRWGCVLAIVLLAVGGALVWYFLIRQDPALTAVTASAGRLTREKDDGGNLKTVARRDRPEVWFRVTLEDVPTGRELPLTCEWVDPAGRVAHRNRYHTREITRTPWTTHARCRLAADAPVGTWTVRLLLEGRELRSQTFEVRDQGKEGGP